MKRIVRQRNITPKEAEHYDSIRERAIRDFPPMQTKSQIIYVMDGYFLFAGRVGEAKGGWNDYCTHNPTIKGCEEAFVRLFEQFESDWYQIVNTKTRKVVKERE